MLKQQHFVEKRLNLDILAIFLRAETKQKAERFANEHKSHLAAVF